MLLVPLLLCEAHHESEINVCTLAVHSFPCDELLRCLYMQVIHYAFHALHVVEMIFAADFLCTETMRDYCRIAQVVLSAAS